MAFNNREYKKSEFNIVKIPIDDLVEYSDSKLEALIGRPQPFKEYSEEKLMELSNSILKFGVLQPISVRPYNGKFQIMAGRNRARAAKIAGNKTIPAIVYSKIDDVQAAVIMLDTNLRQRTNLTYSELAFAYRMKMELLNRRGMRTDLILDTDKVDSLAETGKSNSQSRRTVANLIRLTYLIPELIDLVDKGKVPMIVGVQLSYLSIETQILILDNAIKKNIKLKKDDVFKIRQIEKERKLSLSDLTDLLKESKEKISFTIKSDKLNDYQDILNDKNFEDLFFMFLDHYKCNSVQTLHKD